MKRKLYWSILSLFLFAASAHAQVAQENMGIPLERMRPTADSNGLLGVEWAGVQKKQSLDVSAWFNYANDPLILARVVEGKEERTGSLIQHRMALQLNAAYTVLEWLQAGILLNSTLYQSRPEQNAGVIGELGSLQAAGIGDVSLFGKFRIFSEEQFPFQLTAFSYLSIPSGGSNNYMGDTGFTFEPGVIASRSFGPLKISGNLSYVLRQRQEFLGQIIDDEIRYAAGAGFALDRLTGQPVTAYASVQGAFSATSAFTEARQIPVEFLAGARYRINKEMHVTVGAGAGLISAYGNPDQRVVAAFGYSNAAAHEPEADMEVPKTVVPQKVLIAPQDSDQDGVLDPDDQCPKEAGLTDNAGCPALDRDGDGFVDKDDKCPDKIGIEANQGCPDQDQDQDTVVDRLDQCPADAGIVENQGCPDTDADQDGVVDRLDNCPEEAGEADNEGCPWPDSDGDGVADNVDNCPKEAGLSSNQGCKQKQVVIINKESINITEKILFETSSATIAKRSYKVLDNIVQILKEHPEIKLVRVEGHTDNVGSADGNKRLSQARADSVRTYMIEQGIAPERVQALGHGMEKPIASNSTRRGRAANRRVEFIIPKSE